MLWGAPGAGKTHLLRAAVAAVEARGRPAVFVADAGRRSSRTIPTLLAATGPRRRSTRSTARSPTRRRASSRSSTGCANAAAICSSRAGCRSPRSRCAKTCARGWAGGSSTRSRRSPMPTSPRRLPRMPGGAGFALADDVIAYLLAHGRRDMAALVGALAALDRHSLATKRPITVPLLRELAAARHRPRSLTAALGCAPRSSILGVNRALAEGVNGGDTRITGRSTNRQEVPPRSPRRSPRPRCVQQRPNERQPVRSGPQHGARIAT